MKRILFSFLFSISISIAFSQNIKGKLYDAITKEPIIGASIRISEPVKTFMSNNQGEFNITNSGRKVIAHITALGYKTEELTLSDNEENLIAMKASLDNLQEVVVTANRDAALRTQAPIAINRISPKTLDETKGYKCL
jgi:iron complex outermembrane recepter protein